MYNGGAISWRSHQQSITALSTSEAEYMSLSDSAKEARSLLKLNISLETKTPNNIKIFEDNRGAEKWTRADLRKILRGAHSILVGVKDSPGQKLKLN